MKSDECTSRTLKINSLKSQKKSGFHKMVRAYVSMTYTELKSAV